MNKILIKATLSLCLSIATTAGVYANSAVSDITKIDASVQAEDIRAAEYGEFNAHYIHNTGKIEDILKVQDILKISVTDENNDTIVFNINENTLLYSLNSTEKISFDAFEKGQIVSVFYNVMTPQLLSLPAQIGPEVIILHDNEEDRFVKVDYFDENSLSSDGMLKLNLSEEILILNSKNEMVSFENTKEKNLLVFYEVTTRSLPPQAPPVKVIVLDSDVLKSITSDIDDTENIDSQLNNEDEIISGENLFDLLDEEDIIERDSTRYFALYKVTQIKGLNLSWSAETGTVTVSSPENSLSFTFVNNSTEYGFNRSLRYFVNAPFIMNDRTYVDEFFIDEIEKELMEAKEF